MLDVDLEVRRRSFTVAVALQVQPGERVALFGPSGAGKTTVLEAVAGLRPVDRGHVSLGGRLLSLRRGRQVRQVPPWRRQVVLLRQQPGLFPHLDVRHNLAYAGADPVRLATLAERLELDGLLDARPATLSGGQAQRVAVGRALLGRFEALLLDEPYTGLDARLRALLGELVLDELARRRAPAVLVAHELLDAQAFAERLGVLDQGQLLQIGPPHQVVRRPAGRRVAELVGYRGFVPHGDRLVAVHPEQMVAGGHPDAGVVLAGTVRAVSPAGAGFDVTVAVGAVPVVCRLQQSPAAVGEPVEVTALDPPLLPLGEP